MSFFNYLKQTNMSNIAPYWKRFLSSIIDISIIYGFYVVMYLLTGNKFPYLRPMTFVFSVVYLFLFYSKMNQTIGNMILRIKVVFIEDNKVNTTKSFFLRSLFKSLFFVPIFNLFYLISFYGTIIIVSIIFIRNPIVNKNKLFVWDILSEMIVVEDK